jgi:ABC-type branched-subunit amino acid transport system substrate-binding protein
MQKSQVRRAGALLVGLALVVAACGDDSDEGASDTTAAAVETTAAAVDTTAAVETTVGEPAAGGELAGMKGTTPLPPELAQDFKDRLLTVPSGADLTDYNYAAETYDAVMIIALAVEAAKSDGIEHASLIVDVSTVGEKCSTFTDCKALLDAGTDIDYEGVSGPNNMNGNGEPLSGSYGVLQFGADNRIDDSLTEFVQAESPESAVVEETVVEGTRAGDGVLSIGGLLPQTGSLAFLGAPMFAGAELAIVDLNAAGGVLGQEVKYSAGDSGDTSTDLASQTSDRFLTEGVDAIVGPASSGVALTVIDKISTAGVTFFSPANTSPALSTYADKGLYFRNAPPDTLQGAIIADLVVADGAQTVAIMALDDAYGNGIADVIEASLTDAGITVSNKIIYDPTAASFDTEVNEIAAADPDAIVLITFDEGSRILKTMVELGIGPSAKAIYGCDGNMGNALGENFDAGK